MPESNKTLARAIMMMLIAAFAFSLMTVLIRWSAQALHPFQIAFFRNFFGLVFMLPWLIHHGMKIFKTERLGIFIIRAILGLLSMFSYFWALTVLPLSKAVSLSFTVPLFVTLGAALFLKEKVHIRRWLAIIFGFIGTLVILRPNLYTGMSGEMMASLVVVLSSISMAASVLIIKSLSKTEAPHTIVLYMVLLMTPLSLPVAIPVWQWPEWPIWLAVIAVGFMGSLAHVIFTHAIKMADVSIVVPFDFARLPFVIVLAWFMFDQSVDYLTVLGASMVFASGAYIAHREAQLNKKRATEAKIVN